MYQIPVDAISIVVLCSFVLLYYKKCNSNKDAERFYHKHNKLVYHLLLLSYTIVVLSLWFHARYLIIFALEKINKA